MDADEYERRYMNIESPVIFRDRQRDRSVFVTMFGFSLLLSLMFVLGVDGSMTAFMALAAAVGSVIELAMSSYRVVLTAEALYIQHGLRTRRIPLAVIASEVVAPYRVRDVLCGRGLYARSLDESTECYRARGLNETVRLDWRIGSQERTTIIATDRADELLSALGRARRMNAAEVRIESAIEAREAAEEVEALLHPRAHLPNQARCTAVR